MKVERRQFAYLGVSISVYACVASVPSRAPAQTTTTNDVVIVCISGRGGATDSGMSHLSARLRQELQPFNLPPGNVFYTKWGKKWEDDDPFGAPEVDRIIDEIKRRSTKPRYLAIIGHSYGGWAACRVARELSPDFLALVDPVFGPTNDCKPEDRPKAAYIHNWYQTNGISVDPCTGIGVPCECGRISCGFRLVPGADDNTELEYLTDWDGNVRKKHCDLVGNRKMPADHLTIDDDEGIWHQILNRIHTDLKSRQ